MLQNPELSSGFQFSPTKPCVELCTGTHDSGHSYLVSNDGDGSLTLKVWIFSNPDLFGDKVAQKWDSDLPFLFKVLCGFATLKDLKVVIHNVPEVVDLISDVNADLVLQTSMENEVRLLTEKELSVLRLENQYLSDIGVIVAFFLNHVKLNPGETLFLGANEPHAYLSGKCVECMTASDNVV
ncbi:hypothetical protein KIW84_053348 [Lathyrus oleraceus]|uniref:Phosphomannose isomerase type I catalytic domain-containing protein n=1 Tax=Pisum sativum TaxID=3888 RepID=A0A9D4WRA1_PEA|nr:hypothetical protein KIW84_053348 [Pisum sativum]